MTIKSVPEQSPFVALVMCPECDWAQSATATTSLGHLDNSEALEIELENHKITLHPDVKETHAP